MSFIFYLLLSTKQKIYFLIVYSNIILVFTIFMLFYDSSSATICIGIGLPHILINVVFILLLMKKLKKEEEERDKFADQVQDLYKDD